MTTAARRRASSSDRKLVPVAYENPRNVKYTDAVVEQVSKMSGKCPSDSFAIVDLDMPYVQAAMRGGVDPKTAAAVIFHKHRGDQIVAGSPAGAALGAACPPPQAVPAGGAPAAVDTDTLQPCGPFARVVIDEEKLATCRKKAVDLGSLSKPKNVYELVREYVERETVEVFMVIGLDVNAVVNCYSEVARGQNDHVAVAPQQILAPVLMTACKGFVMIHSHPSGDAHPSKEDGVLTERVREAARVFPGLVMLDHLVIGHGEYYSFTAKRLFKA